MANALSLTVLKMTLGTDRQMPYWLRWWLVSKNTERLQGPAVGVEALRWAEDIEVCVCEEVSPVDMARFDPDRREDRLGVGTGPIMRGLHGVTDTVVSTPEGKLKRVRANKSTFGSCEVMKIASGEMWQFCLVIADTTPTEVLPKHINIVHKTLDAVIMIEYRLEVISLNIRIFTWPL